MIIMDRINDAVAWYQQRIGAYDKQLWEKSVEQSVLKSIHQVPKKTAKVKPELIDVDLVRGSTFTKAKPQHGFFAVSRRGLLHMLFMPFFFSWWSKQSSRMFAGLLALLYFLEVVALVLYFTDSGEFISQESVSSAHVLGPAVIMVILAVLHGQIVATRLTYQKSRQRSVKEKRKHGSRSKQKKKRSPSCYKPSADHDSASQETGVEATEEKISSHSNKRLRVSARANLETESSFDDGLGVDSQRSHNIGSQLRRRNVPKKSGADKFEAAEPCNSNVNYSQVTNNLQTVAHMLEVASDIPNANLPSKNGNALRVAVEDLGLKVEANKPQDGEPFSCHTDEGFAATDQVVEVSGELILPQNNGFQLTSDLFIPCDISSKRELAPSCDKDTVSSKNPRPRTSKNRRIFGPQDAYLNEKMSENRRPSITLLSANDPSQLDGQPCMNGVTVDNSQGESDEPLDSSFQESGRSVINGENTDKISEGCGSRDGDLDTPERESLPEFPTMDCAEKVERPSSHVVGVKQRRTHRHARRSRPGRENSATVEDGGESSSRSRTRTKLNSGGLTVRILDTKESTGVSSCESELDTTPHTPDMNREHGCVKTTTEDSITSDDGETSEVDWEDTMNSDVTSTDSSSCTASDSDISDRGSATDNPFSFGQKVTHSSSVMSNLASASDKVSCMIWEKEEVKKVDLSVLDIGWTIIQKVDEIPETCDYLLVGCCFSLLHMLMPVLFRLYHIRTKIDWAQLASMPDALNAATLLLGGNCRVIFVVLNGILQRLFLSVVFFFLLSVAERTFKQRLLYAKHFCYLTSSRRAKKYELPHFRLNKVRNIKTWLSLRSYMKKRGPQRSVDCIVSAAFLLAVSFMSLICVELLKESEGFLDHLGNWEIMAWCMAIGVYLLRFMTLGTKINKKYRNFSTLITEQINLYLHMEQKPHKKEELMLANSVLKLANDLLKELESPFKISGFSANPFLYNTTKVVILSAFSAILTELLGFKLKLYKIKIRT